MVQIVLGGQHHGGLVRLVGESGFLLPCHHRQHPYHPAQHRGHRHRRRLGGCSAVQPGQAQQILGDAGQALSLLADVRHKFPCGLGVHVVGLKNGVRQQADSRQRRFQLVAGIGDELAAGALRALETVGEAVELRCQLGDLVRARHLGPVTVSPLPHLTDGLQQVADAAGEHPGEQGAEEQHEQGHQKRDAHDIGLEAPPPPPLLGVSYS